MKLFRLITERDGATSREPGKVTTDVKREQFWYAAESADDAWSAAKLLCKITDSRLMALIEEAPLITVLQDAAEEK